MYSRLIQPAMPALLMARRRRPYLLMVIALLLWACNDQVTTNVTQNSTSVEPVAAASSSGAKPEGMVLISAGEFVLGSDKVDDSGKQQEYGLINPLYLDEHPQQTLQLDAFYLDTYEVTNAEYKFFVHQTNHKEPFSWSQNGYNLVNARLEATDLKTLRWISAEYFKLDVDTTTMDKVQLLSALYDQQRVQDSLPVTMVTWHDAHAYCQWAKKRLPTEQEWEKAARGPKGLEYPWGDQWDPNITNIGDNTSWPGGIAPVGYYPNNKSLYGAYDLSGNAWEWVDSWYQPYVGSTLQRKAFGETNKVLRGGGGGVGHYALSLFFRGAARAFAPPETASDDIGFRCARTP